MSLQEIAFYRKKYIGGPTPIYFAERLTELAGGAKIYLKREVGTNKYTTLLAPTTNLGYPTNLPPGNRGQVVTNERGSSDDRYAAGFSLTLAS